MSIDVQESDAESDPAEGLCEGPEAMDMDALHILPLSILPLETAGLKRAKLIKNVRLETVVELFNDPAAGSGQVEPSSLTDVFSWSSPGTHPDERMIAAMCSLHSFDVYSLRIELRRLGIEVDNVEKLKLSKHKCVELTQYMEAFTAPLLKQIYGDTHANIESMSQLVEMFAAPDKTEALENLNLMADKLHIDLVEVPDFLEEYGDIFLSLAYSKNCLDALVPKIVLFEESMSELKENYQLCNDQRLMRSIDVIKDCLTDVTATIASRLENFDQSSQTMWESITAESFAEIKKMIQAHHVSVGALLCSLSVKMDHWQRKVGAVGGLVNRADFVKSDMVRGMEKIREIEAEIAKQQLRLPTLVTYQESSPAIAP